MELKIRKIGNGYGVILPKSLMDGMALGEGSLLKAENRDGILDAGRCGVYPTGSGLPANGRAASAQFPRTGQMTLIYLRADVLRAVHAHLIQTYGGLQGIRDATALESAVARPKQLHHYTGETRVGAIAASLSWGILRNHRFADGNKRVALAALAMSAQLNHHRLNCSEPEETAMVLRAASSSISEDEWTAWALRVVVPK